ncbi:MAG: isopentenyl phosphate kinase [Candidatus Micrarchaeota archaeon]|nr:isopentenyl phosphate kinase [Candidatus Micrarchaeota archaeon]
MQILKLGGSVITKKEGFMQADKRAISRLAKEVARAWEEGVRDIVLVHGAGSFGHPLVIKYGINDGVRTMEQQRACKKVQESCAKLSFLVESALKKEGVPAVSIAPHSLVVSKNKRIQEFDCSPVFEALSEGKMPILYGDMVMDEELGYSVCSGDQITAYLGKNARRVIFATNVDGVLANGKLVRRVTAKNFEKIKRHLAGSGTPDVTGGMAGKIMELSALKVPCFIVNAAKARRVEALLLGKKAICTELLF